MLLATALSRACEVLGRAIEALGTCVGNCCTAICTCVGKCCSVPHARVLVPLYHCLAAVGNAFWRCLSGCCRWLRRNILSPLYRAVRRLVGCIARGVCSVAAALVASLRAIGRRIRNGLHRLLFAPLLAVTRALHHNLLLALLPLDTSSNSMNGEE